MLTRTVLAWTGLPGIPGRTDTDICRVLSAMIKNAGHVGPATIVAMMRRTALEKRLCRLVRAAREEKASPREGSPFDRILAHRDADGEPLDDETAVVELLNILRPVVAIGRYIVFTALALHQHPRQGAALNGADRARYEAFAEEVRRLYPFFPFVGSRVVEPLSWRDYALKRGDWLLLDLYGTMHDPRQFPHPDEFDAERGISWRDQGYDFIPQGAGRAEETHRCPGERLTVALMTEAARLLVEETDWSVPDQDQSISLRSIPVLPRDGFVIAVSRTGPANL